MMRRVFGFVASMAAVSIAGHAQTYTVLDSFTATQGPYARAGLVQGIDGNLYGAEGGGHYVATVLKITPNGEMTTLYTFPIPGFNFTAGLAQATNGFLYGVSPGIEYTDQNATIFRFKPSGDLATVATLCTYCEDPDYPLAGLIQAADGNLYGTASGGGTYYLGSVFKMTPSGTITTIASFCGENCSQGGWDPTGPLVQGTDENFYGVTYNGGITNVGGGYGFGTAFKVTAGGLLTTLYRFCHADGCPDGAEPTSLLQGTDGNFYGTTLGGGARPSKGTIFKLTPEGTLTTLYNFCAASHCTDGSEPQPELIQASDGNFYGTTLNGGSSDACGSDGCGSIFRLTPGGILTTLYNFCSQDNCVDGYAPAAGLAQATNGDFYGVTNGGGAEGLGTVFRLSAGLAPFVETLPRAGVAGEAIEILGTDLTGATSVNFNGAPAAFRVASDSLIVATVPARATTGTVQVTTRSGILSSNVPFVLVPAADKSMKINSGF